MESSPVEPSQPVEAPVKEVTYAEVAAAITKLANDKGRDAALAVLAQFSIKKLPEAKPEEYAAILGAVNEEALV